MFLILTEEVAGSSVIPAVGGAPTLVVVVVLFAIFVDEPAGEWPSVAAGQSAFPGNIGYRRFRRTRLVLDGGAAGVVVTGHYAGSQRSGDSCQIHGESLRCGRCLLD